MSNITVFQFDSFNVRFVGSYENPWWIASDVCKAIGIKNVSQAVNGYEKTSAKGTVWVGGLDDDEKAFLVVTAEGYYLQGFEHHNMSDIEGGICLTYNPLELSQGKHLVVNESGLYHLIFRSYKPKAQKFRKWVTKEVLPSVRKTGQYSVNQLNNKPEFNAEREGIQLMNERLQQMEQMIKELHEVRGIKRIPSVLPPGTPFDQIPPDYIECSDGHWVSPAQYERMRDGSSRSLIWEARKYRSL
jgi:prophage antirepressor-like protein